MLKRPARAAVIGFEQAHLAGFRPFHGTCGSGLMNAVTRRDSMIMNEATASIGKRARSTAVPRNNRRSREPIGLAFS